jgi:hypothetical protein
MNSIDSRPISQWYVLSYGLPATMTRYELAEMVRGLAALGLRSVLPVASWHEVGDAL